MAIQFKNLRNVRFIPGEVDGYILLLDIDYGDGEGFIESKYCARPNGGGICDEVISLIKAGEFEGEISEFVPETRIPDIISMRQAKIILHRYGLLSSVEAIIQNMPDPDGTEARIDWEYATTFERSNKWLEVFKTQLNLTDEQIDQMFIEASKI